MEYVLLPVANNHLEDSNESIRLFAEDGVIADCQNVQSYIIQCQKRSSVNHWTWGER